MIYETFSRFSRRYPVLARGLTDVVVFVIFGWAALWFVADTITDGNKTQCERGNSFRVLEMRELEDLILAKGERRAAELVGGEKDKAEATEAEIEAYRTKQEGLIALAQSSGHAITERGVTINCEAEYPNPLTIG